MNEYADRWAPGLVAMDEDLVREFEARLVESSRLAFRVAYSVLHHCENAEDVAQEALARAYRRFRHLRDRSFGSIRAGGKARFRGIFQVEL